MNAKVPIGLKEIPNPNFLWENLTTILRLPPAGLRNLASVLEVRAAQVKANSPECGRKIRELDSDERREIARWLRTWSTTVKELSRSFYPIREAISWSLPDASPFN